MDPKTPQVRKPAAGFSLVELLIVTVVLGIIMAITIATLANALDKSRQGATIADMRNLAAALQAYQVDYSVLPADDDFAIVAQSLRYHDDAKIPVNDHWGFTYHYETESGGYTLRSFGKDGVEDLSDLP